MSTESSLRISCEAAISILKKQHCLVAHYGPQPLNPSGQSRIWTDSRRVDRGDIFIAYPGIQHDSHAFVAGLAAQKPGLVIIEDPSCLPATLTFPTLLVKNSREAWSWVCAAAADLPQDKLQLWGVTGTNGKTSCVWMLRALLTAHGEDCLSLGTLGVFGSPTAEKPATHTTPDPPELFSILARYLKAGGKHVAMEASSHSSSQKKIAPLAFSGLAWTSFSQDHLDFHGTMQAYKQAKWDIFTQNLAAQGRAILPSDLCPDLPLDELLQRHPEASLVCFRSLSAPSAARAACLEAQIEELSPLPLGSKLKLRYQGIHTTGQIPYLGAFNASNFLAALLLAEKALGFLPEPATWQKLAQIPGRLERISPRTPKRGPHPTVLVDFAHTPDALSQVLHTLRPYCAGKLHLVFGCGGDRDAGKRPLMAQAAAAGADTLTITSDNPRSEDPAAIIEAIRRGLPATAAARTQVTLDREQAIAASIAAAKPSDLVLIAGKGHETYQIIGDEKRPFDDRLIAQKYL